MTRFALATASLLHACGLTACEWDFERMIDQPSVGTLEPTAYFADGSSMRPAPPGTVVFGAHIEGQDEGAERIPLRLDRAALDRGKDRFAIFCAPCHGVQADAVAEVARHMRIRKPPSLLARRITAMPAGRLYRVVSEGYGLMPSLSHALDRQDRWSVVAYLQVLQLQRAVRLDQLSERRRREADAWLD